MKGVVMSCLLDYSL